MANQSGSTHTRPKPASEPKGLPARQVRLIAKALSDPRRFAILQSIAAQPCSPCTNLRAGFPITAATLSHHLKELESAGLITTIRRGKYLDAIFCRDIWHAYLAELQKL